MPSPSFSRRVIDIGFISALILAAIAFVVAGWYLSRFADGSQAVVTQILEAAKPGREVSATAMELMQNSLGVHAYVARVLLVSCGMFVGLAFGFLGFALFLVGATGASDVTVSGANRSLSASATALAPGTIAILAASILVGICVTRPLPVNLELGAGGADPNARARLYGDDPLSKADAKAFKPAERVPPAASSSSKSP